MKIDAKILYEAIEATGETLNGAIHILHQNNDEMEQYRVYHKNGYCFDVKKEYACEPDEISQFEDVWPDGFNYSFYSEWEGFKNDLTVETAFDLIKNNSHLPIGYK